MRLTLQTKLLGAVGLLAGVALLAVGSAAWTTARLGSEMDEAVNVAARKVDAVGEFSTIVDRMRIAGRQILVYSFFHKPEVVAQEIQKLETARPLFERAAANVKSLFTSPAEQAALSDAASRFGDWTNANETVKELCSAGKPEKAAAASQKMLRPIMGAFEKARTGLLAMAQQEMRTPASAAGRCVPWRTGCRLRASSLCW